MNINEYKPLCNEDRVFRIPRSVFSSTPSRGVALPNSPQILSTTACSSPSQPVGHSNRPDGPLDNLHQDADSQLGLQAALTSCPTGVDHADELAVDDQTRRSVGLVGFVQ